MKLMFLGTGAAFIAEKDNFQSNMLLISPSGKKLLFDCGSDISRSLHYSGFSYKDIDAIFISHYHSDHVGGLEFFAKYLHFDPSYRPIKLIINSNLSKYLWRDVLSGPLEEFNGKHFSVNDYFYIQSVDDNEPFIWENVSFIMAQVFHYQDAFRIMPCYGLYFNTGNYTVFISGDCQYMKHALSKYYQYADLIFHDCETDAKPSGVHANYRELVELDADIKKKIWLYHFNYGPLPDACADGFQGFIKCRQIFDFDHPSLS